MGIASSRAPRLMCGRRGERLDKTYRLRTRDSYDLWLRRQSRDIYTPSCKQRRLLFICPTPDTSQTIPRRRPQ